DFICDTKGNTRMIAKITTNPMTRPLFIAQLTPLTSVLYGQSASEQGSAFPRGSSKRQRDFYDQGPPRQRSSGVPKRPSGPLERSAQRVSSGRLSNIGERNSGGAILGESGHAR